MPVCGGMFECVCAFYMNACFPVCTLILSSACMEAHTCMIYIYEDGGAVRGSAFPFGHL